MKSLATLIILLMLTGSSRVRAGDRIVYEGKSGPGKGKHIVFLAGDEEYRSEEGLPQLAKILSQRHGFKCTVLFPLNSNGEIDPNAGKSEPGLEALDSADLCVMLLRFRAWPDEQMKHFVDYYLAGKPIIALRTSTHAFSFGANSAYAKFSWNGKGWPGGFGRQVLGETWVDHWGRHKSEATRGVIESMAKNHYEFVQVFLRAHVQTRGVIKSTLTNHPILRGVTDIFGDTDVYEAHPVEDAKVLVWGQVLKGMKPGDPPADYKRKTNKGVEQGVNDPMQPVVWVRDHKNEAGKVNKIVTTTMGSATDLQNEGLRRLLVNAAYWTVGLEKKIPAKANVDYVGGFQPTMYGFNGFKKGVKPSDHELK